MSNSMRSREASGPQVANAFDREALIYDDDFGRNPIGLHFRSIFQRRLLALLPPGSRVLDLGCGTGEDAIFLASSGFTVHGVDASPCMIQRARTKASERGIPESRLRFEQRAAEDLSDMAALFDGAFSDFGALNCADVAAVGRGLALVLPPGAPVIMSFMGPRPLPATVARLLMRRGAPRSLSHPRVGGISIPVSYPTVRKVRELMGEGFEWRGAFALGVLVPGPDHVGWATRHPRTFAVLRHLESAVRRLPGLRSLGDHIVLEGVRS